MTRRQMAALVVVAAIPLLAACGASGQPAAAPTSPEMPNGASVTGTGDQTSSGNPVADLDVCALLSPEDAAAVAQEQGLSGSVASATTYTLSSTMQDYNPASAVLGFVDTVYAASS